MSLKIKLPIKSILIIEDDKMVCSLLEQAFKKSEYTTEDVVIKIASTIHEAKALLVEPYCDLITLDGSLPDGTASDMFPFLQKRRLVEKTVVITSSPQEWIDKCGMASVMLIEKDVSNITKIFK